MKGMAKTALVTNATGFAGPGAVQALIDGGFRVVAQDRSFTCESAWRAFQDGRENLVRCAAASPESTIQELFEIADKVDAIVSNDHYPAGALSLDEAPVEELQSNYAHLVETPFRLIQAALPKLRIQGGANVVMITSNRMKLPLSGGAFPDAARAAANAMVRSLAVDCAKDKITVNAVAPNFLYSEAYYPKAVFEGTEDGRKHIADSVPGGRLADPSEIGELIYFLATAKTRFLTGAVIDFSGGWPFGAPRPEL